MPIEVDGKPVAAKDFYPDIMPPKGVKAVIFRRCGFEPHKRIVTSLDLGPNQPPMPTSRAATKDIHTGGVVIPLWFDAKIDITGKEDSASTQNVHFYKSKVAIGGMTGAQTFTGDEIYIKGRGATLNVNTPEGIQIFKVLALSPLNKANAAIYGTKQPLFELEDIESQRKEQNKSMREKTRIIALAYNETEVPDALAIHIHREIATVQGLGANTDMLVASEQWETLRGDLAQYAYAYPDKFDKLVKDANVGTRSLIKEALAVGVLNKNKTRWMWGEIQAIKNKKEFCVISVGQDPVQELLNHFITRVGKEDLKLLEKEMDLRIPKD